MSEILETYWAPHFGNTDEATALVSYLAQASGDPIEVHTLFGDLGLDGLSGNYTATELDGYGDAFLLVAALSVLMAENKASGGVNLGELGGADKSIRLHVESKENTQINTALKYFALSPEDHAAADRFDEDELSELANLSEELRGQLD
ncbi:imm68 putative immunity domain-containing protein [Corynebacterium glutamicum]|uniref:imm68 putative immunity domain-containing protein n=1 Tax=Corynebacterium glutamicum TaxID=1718 RepID=UPI000744D63F|nr:imm68 putative immunity domain-containing protein [Corynebacterium glutamicum]ALZ99390.1 hypothetical protein APT58_03640 [Corynebacterium glutamicum]